MFEYSKSIKRIGDKITWAMLGDEHDPAAYADITICELIKMVKRRDPKGGKYIVTFLNDIKAR